MGKHKARKPKDCQNDRCGDFNRGILSITVQSWINFQDKVREFQDNQYIWRGQQEDLPLKASFDRSPQCSKSERKEQLRKHLENFKKEMEQSHPHVLPKNDDEIWALGQHYGLKTPLLDWTESPFVAAYFAFEKTVEQNGKDGKYRYVYALRKGLKRLLAKSKRSGMVLSINRYVEILDAESLKHLSPRFRAQKGIFTKTLNGDDIERNIDRWTKKRQGDVILVKFKIPTQERIKCLGDLQQMMIDHESLLLDLRDVVDKCNDCL